MLDKYLRPKGRSIFAGMQKYYDGLKAIVLTAFHAIKKSGYDVDNLWVADLTGYWRMLYTLKGSEIEILCFVLEIVDHERYDKIFGYRKK